jgi:nitrile hydratase accessory protein
MAIPDTLKVPGDAGGPIFQEPWQARSFALVVSLCRDGQYEWDDFRRLLIAEIGAADAAGDGATGYYDHWLAASEKLLTARGLVAAGDLTGRKIELKANPPEPTKAVPNPVYVDPGRR